MVVESDFEAEDPMTVPTITFTEPHGPSGAPLLVLGHALGSGPLIWDDADPLLTQHFRVTAVTLPGHAGAPSPSEAFTMAELADAVAGVARSLINGGSAFYAGVSIGGAIALELGLNRADTFSAVASLASGAELGGPAQWEPRAATVRAHSTASLAETTAERWFTLSTRENKPELVERILQTLRDTDDEGYARCSEALGGFDIRPRLGDISIPVLALWGENDPVGTEAKQQEIVAGVQRGEIALVTDAAHQVSAEQPEQVANHLIDFFSRV